MAHNNKTEESLYVMVENPDVRKRFTITYEKNENENESIVLMIPPTLTSFAVFLNLLVTKFKLDASNRSHIRVKTIEGRRIKSLVNTYNNQILKLTISELSDQDPEDEQSNQLTKSQEYQQELAEKQNTLSKSSEKSLPLFNDPNENVYSKFYDQIIQVLKDKYEHPNRVIIGESYPYRCKLLISDYNRDSKIWLYFIEEANNEKTTKEELNYKIEVIVEVGKLDGNSLNKKRNEIIGLVEEQYKQDRYDIMKLVDIIESYYKKNFFITPSFGVLDRAINLFVEKEKLNTYSQNVLLDGCYKSLNFVSNYFDIPISLSRKLLFHNQWNENLVCGKASDKNENTSIIRSYSHPHKTKDIKLFKFNSLIEEKGEGGEVECSICYCDYEKSEMVELLCGHSFCKGCLGHYFKSNIEDANGGSIPINCPSIGCLNKCIDEVTVETLLPESYLTLNALKIMVKDVLYSKPNSHSCPEQGCGRVVLNLKSTHRYIPYVSCSDHNPWCIFCKKSGLHWPLNCSQSYKDNDLFSYRWIVMNTTICNRCKYPVERNQGCAHMTCSQCRYEFCYHCGQDYKTHTTCGVNGRGKENKLKIFFSTITKSDFNVDISFMEEFFKKGSFETNDIVVKHIYESFITLITERSFVNKSHLQLLQSAIFFLHSHMKSAHKTKEEKFTLNSCQKIITKLLRPDIFGEKARLLSLSKKNGPSVLSVSVTICENGSKKAIAKVFVNSQFSDFKQEIVNQLNKAIPSDQAEYDPKKIRLFNLYGGQIKSSNEILNDEPIFITASIHEKWVEPQIPTLTEEEIEKVKNQIELENEKDIVVEFGKNTKTFTTLKPKQKRMNDKLKLKEKHDLQLKLQEKLKLDIQNATSNNNNVPLITDEIRDQYYYYRNSLIDTDDSDEDYDDSDEFEQYNEEDLKDVVEEKEEQQDKEEQEAITMEGEDEFVNIDSNSSSSEFEDDDDELLQLKKLQEQEYRLLSAEQAQEKAIIEKEQKQIDMVFKILEMYQDEKFGLDFDKVFSLCLNAKSLSHAIKIMTGYLEETYYSNQYGITQQYLLIKERLVFNFPNLSLTVIDRAIKESNYNLDKAKVWIYNKYSKQQKKNLQKQQKSIKPPTAEAQPSTSTRNIKTSEQFELYSDDDEDNYDVDEAENTIEDGLHSKYKTKYGQQSKFF